MRLIYLFLFSALLVMVSCKSETKKTSGNKVKTEKRPVKTKKDNAKKIVNKNGKQAKGKPKTKKNSKSNKNQYWADLSKATGINKDQVARLKSIKKKYTALTDDLKKKGKWEGAKNAAQRNAQNARMESEIKGALGQALYAKKVSFDKKRRSK